MATTTAPAFRLSIRWENLDETIRGFRRLPVAVRQHLPRASKNIALLVRRFAREGVGGRGSFITLAKRTGGFQRSIILRKISLAGHVVGSTHPGAVVHERGATIRAKRGRYLHFKWGPGPNDWARVEEVRIRARPWLRPAVEKAKRRVRPEFRNALRRGLKDAGFGTGSRTGLSPFSRAGIGQRTLATHSPEVRDAAAALNQLLSGG